ncbi:hypothetical protein PENSTE_c035G05913 [Penicillium steckii]|uniref:Uncharacterized protein n=1 Tax=Penicillium steckii TaxID=303698 RepID=A0A1V6SLA4_9EURO|nr:hypothetical protein PENSTE_c035G05913 [Penicillium steckii]
MTYTAGFYEQFQDYNWLDAMSKNRTFFDPRTIEVHHYTVPSSNPERTPLSGKINPYTLATLPSVDQRTSVAKWAREVSPDQEQVKTKAVSPRFAEEDYMYSPFDHIEVPSMTLSSTFTDSTLQGSIEELNICKLIAGKVRQAAAHSAATYDKLKRKLKC